MVCHLILSLWDDLDACQMNDLDLFRGQNGRKFRKYIYANALSLYLIYCLGGGGQHITLRSPVFTEQYFFKYCYNVAETTGEIVHVILCFVSADQLHKNIEFDHV